MVEGLLGLDSMALQVIHSSEKLGAQWDVFILCSFTAHS